MSMPRPAGGSRADQPAGTRPGWAAVRAGAAGGARAAAAAARAVLSPTGVKGVAVEAVWGAAHLAVYPWGLVREQQREHDRYRLEGMGPAQRGLLVGDVEAAGTPILLLHGMVDNRSVFTLLRRGMRRRGFGRVLTLNYSPVTNDVRAAAQDLALEVEALCEQTGYERVHVVGHSMGGLIARYYVQCLGGDERVDTLVTLATPHAGTMTAHLVGTTLTRQLRPGSDLMSELAAPVERCRTRFIAYWSDLDQMIVPQRRARLVHPDLAVRNHLVRGAGHMSLPVSPRLVHEISAALGQLSADGSTDTRGVTTLPVAGG
jgi:pimeloyl-ACP methyl ester carboxylesterase